MPHMLHCLNTRFAKARHIKESDMPSLDIIDESGTSCDDEYARELRYDWNEHQFDETTSQDILW
jgi:hypothetical protein